MEESEIRFLIDRTNGFPKNKGSFEQLKSKDSKSVRNQSRAKLESFEGDDLTGLNPMNDLNS